MPPTPVLNVICLLATLLMPIAGLAAPGADVGDASTPDIAGEHAKVPQVGGPERVTDWWRAGQAFIRRSEHIQPIHGKAKNVILFIGDGMGISTITAARILEGQLRGEPGEENSLFFETLPYVALSKTYSWDQQTPDSAPTMTAMMTGYKTRDGMLSIDHATARGECDADTVASHALPTLLEQAAMAGKSTGIVSTARITHATPAATYAHTPDRDWEGDAMMPAGCGVKDISRQLVELSPTVMASLKVALGGGREFFMMSTQADPEYPGHVGARRDGRDLIRAWLASRNGLAAGSQYVWNKAGFEQVDPRKTPYLLGLFEPSHMQWEADRLKDVAGEPSLSEMTTKSLKMLEREAHGFFLMVEAARIDHAHHAGNAKRALLDTIELAHAVKAAYAMTDPRETMIIVTADHGHVFTIAGYPHRGNPILGLVSPVPAQDGHAPVPARDVHGLPYTTLNYVNGPGAGGQASAGARLDPGAVDTTADNYRQQALVPLSSETHSGEDVAIYASGPKAYLVHGTMEQNWIYHVMRAAFGWTAE
ncbi:MAG TPA: alkaline phosphatase [Methylophilaceae bacterium]|nr:alkaline phosphatase [Methylophilaceae bacterium]